MLWPESSALVYAVVLVPSRRGREVVQCGTLYDTATKLEAHKFGVGRFRRQLLYTLLPSI